MSHVKTIESLLDTACKLLEGVRLLPVNMHTNHSALYDLDCDIRDAATYIQLAQHLQRNPTGNFSYILRNLDAFGRDRIPAEAWQHLMDLNANIEHGPQQD